MIKINIHQAKTHLSALLKKISKNGEVIILCNRNIPVAEIKPIAKKSKKLRPFGLDSDRLKIPSSFFEELPEDITNSFY